MYQAGLDGLVAVVLGLLASFVNKHNFFNCVAADNLAAPAQDDRSQICHSILRLSDTKLSGIYGGALYSFSEEEVSDETQA
jgi:hypothetical protein